MLIDTSILDAISFWDKRNPLNLMTLKQQNDNNHNYDERIAHLEKNIWSWYIKQEESQWEEEMREFENVKQERYQNQQFQWNMMREQNKWKYLITGNLRYDYDDISHEKLAENEINLAEQNELLQTREEDAKEFEKRIIQRREILRELDSWWMARPWRILAKHEQLKILEYQIKEIQIKEHNSLMYVPLLRKKEDQKWDKIRQENELEREEQKKEFERRKQEDVEKKIMDAKNEDEEEQKLLQLYTQLCNSKGVEWVQTQLMQHSAQMQKLKQEELQKEKKEQTDIQNAILDAEQKQATEELQQLYAQLQELKQNAWVRNVLNEENSIAKTRQQEITLLQELLSL